MGQVIAFPRWQVIARAQDGPPGEPRMLIDPHGRLHPIEATLQRRLIAAPDPALPIRYESVVQVRGEHYLLSWIEGDEAWEVQPAS